MSSFCSAPWYWYRSQYQSVSLATVLVSLAWLLKVAPTALAQTPDSLPSSPSSPPSESSTPALSPEQAAATSDRQQPQTYGAHASTERIAPAAFLRYGTGSRVNAPLEELPSTISTVDDTTMRERGATNLEQALNLVPGVTPVWTYGGFLYLSMRGFQAISLIDGLRDSRPMIAGSAPQGALFDLDRIEVLRGPSSVLYGYGAVGGVVNLIRKQPSRTQQHTFDVGLGTLEQTVLHAGSQGPLGEQLAYRVDVGRVTRTDVRGATTERNQVTSSVLYTPVRAHSIGVRLSYEFDHYNTDVGIPTTPSASQPGKLVLPPGARYDARYNTKNDFLDYRRLELEANYRWDITRKTYLQARANVVDDYYDYLAAESLTYVPAQGTTPAMVDRGYLHFQRGWTPIVGQVELHSEAKTGPIQHQWVLGYEFNDFLGKSNRGNTGTAVPGSVEFVYPEDAAASTHALQRTSQDHYRHLVHSIYGFDHIHLLPNLIASGGLRFDSVHSRVQREFFDASTGREIADPASGQYRRPLYESPSALTGQAGLVYTPWTPLTVYAGYSSAFKPNFVSTSQTETNNYDPERSQQIEGGVRVRASGHGHTLDIDAAVYLIDKRDVLIQLGTDRYSQAGKVSSRGADLAVRYTAPKYLGLDATYALIHARYDEFVTPDPTTGDPISLAGKRTAFTPRHSGQLWLRLAPSERVTLAIGGRWVGRQYADQYNQLALPQYALLDMSASIRGERVSFVVSARNVLDKRDYFVSAINDSQITPGPGREVLGTLRLTL